MSSPELYDQKPWSWWNRTLRLVGAYLVATAAFGACGYVGGSLAVAGAEPVVVYIEVPAEASTGATRASKPLPERTTPIKVYTIGDSTSVWAEDSWAALDAERPDIEVIGTGGILACEMLRPSSGWAVLYTTHAPGDCDWSKNGTAAAAAASADVVVASWGVFILGDYGSPEGEVAWVSGGRWPATAVDTATMVEMDAFEAAVAPAKVLWVTYPPTDSLGEAWVRLADEDRNRDAWKMLTAGRCFVDIGGYVTGNISQKGRYVDGVHFTVPVQKIVTGMMADATAQCLAEQATA